VSHHIDLIQNNWGIGRQELAARIFVEPGGYGLIVKDATEEQWEVNVFDVVGSLASHESEEIVERLMTAYDGPYVVASELHCDDDCPFNGGHVAIERKAVGPAFLLERPRSA